MSAQNQPYNGPLAAWVDPREFIPTLHVGGTIPTNGEKPEVTLTEAEPQGINPKDLLLDMRPDVYDPKGDQQLLITEFQKPLSGPDQYTSVTIRTQNGSIHLQVQKQLPQQEAHPGKAETASQ